jgi:two-component system sensor kinase FixL
MQAYTTAAISFAIPTGKALRVVGAMSDFTERDRAEAELQRIQAELIHVSRLSAMGAMGFNPRSRAEPALTAVASYVRGGLRRLSQSAEPPSQEVVAASRPRKRERFRQGKL